MASAISLACAAAPALYNNLGQDEGLAIKVDYAVRANRPDAWRGVKARENVVKGSIYGVVADDDEVERLFKIIQKHFEY